MIERPGLVLLLAASTLTGSARADPVRDGYRQVVIGGAQR